GRAQNLYPGLAGGTQTAQPLLPSLRLDGRLDSRSTSKSVWRCGWVLQRPEFPATGGVDLGGRDVRLGSTASGHSAFPPRSTGSEYELSASHADEVQFAAREHFDEGRSRRAARSRHSNPRRWPRTDDLLKYIRLLARERDQVFDVIESAAREQSASMRKKISGKKPGNECRTSRLTRKNAGRAHGCWRKSYVKHVRSTSLLAG